ncbi:hypothetical protein A3C18_01030 [Candidatus Kaiserbacteria bacterium RIFCSPHIGHO2_02_FULL_54_11b]|nr:MAG: hypothetical protein A3C18_01030 [Candidatus Kaiserbacteria bacterium RIFCSPHIGHO2_02_FULL_54_11b]
MTRLAFSPNIPALKEGLVIGPKVLDKEAFARIVFQCVPSFIENTQPDDEQEDWRIKLPLDVLPLVSSGVGRRTKSTEHYVMRVLHGRVDLFLKREHALPPEECLVIVLTKEMYLADCREFEEKPLDDAALEGVTHVVVSVRVVAGPTKEHVMREHDYLASLARMVGTPPNRVEVVSALNRAWNINNYWRTFAEVSD